MCEDVELDRDEDPPDDVELAFDEDASIPDDVEALKETPSSETSASIMVRNFPYSFALMSPCVSPVPCWVVATGATLVRPSKLNFCFLVFQGGCEDLFCLC